MRFGARLAPVLFALAGAIPAWSTVQVSSPVDGSSVTNPVNYSATAFASTCSGGVGAMGVYVDNVLVFVSQGSVLNTTLALSPGPHGTVVEEWDHCGGASYTRMSITVSQPTVAAPAFSVPSGSYTTAQSVQLSAATQGASIYYTVDGSMPSAAANLYMGPITVASTQTINAIALAPGTSPSPVSSAAYSITLPTAPPQISLPSGSYSSAQSVLLTDATPGAGIYYTTDGSIPTAASARYISAITVASTQTLNAVAIAPSYSNSVVASAAYTILAPAAPPIFAPAPASYTTAQNVTLATSTPGAIIYYTLDGSQPTTASFHYSAPINITTSQTINAIAVAANYSNSAVASGAYNVTVPAAPVRFTLPAGTYTSIEALLLINTTPGGVIYYTTDGSTPSAASSPYTGPIMINASQTVKAITIAPNYAPGPVCSETFTVNLPAAVPAFSLPSGIYTTVQTVTMTDPTPGAMIYYTTNGAAPSPASTLYTGPITVSSTEFVMAMAVAPGYGNSRTVGVSYIMKLAPAGPTVPAGATVASMLQMNPRWSFRHDPGTPGTASGQWSVVGNPSTSGSAAQFSSSYANWGGEIYHLSYGVDAQAQNYLYDAQVWIQQGSEIANIEMDMNQVIPDGDTVIFGFQCDGVNGTWDYSGNVGAIRTSKVTWYHSTQPCDPNTWEPNTWHHVQISYSRDAVGHITYNTVWLDGVAAQIGITIPSAQTLGWPMGDLITNFQVDGDGGSGSSIVYVDNLTISRW